MNKEVPSLSDVELHNLERALRQEKDRRARKELEENPPLHVCERYDAFTIGVFLKIPIDDWVETDDDFIPSPDIRPELDKLKLRYVPFTEDPEDTFWYVSVDARMMGDSSDWCGGEINSFTPSQIEKRLAQAKKKCAPLLKKFKGSKIFFGTVSDYADW